MPRDLLEAITARADALLEHLPGALDGRGRETHRARVAARRLAEVLPLIGAAGERVARQVRDVRRLLGAGREIDVTMDLLAEQAARHEWAPALVARVQRHLEAVAKKRRASSHDILEDVDPSKLRRGIRAAGVRAAKISTAVALKRLHERREAREASLARAARASGAMYDVERLHRVRIHVKKLRYVIEAAGDMTGRRAATRIASLSQVQEHLGRLHDLQVLQGQIRSVESGFVPGRGRVAHGLARMADDVETDCRALHAAVLPRIRAAWSHE